MFVQFILGTIYFVLFVTVLSFSLSFIAIPVFQEMWGVGAIMNLARGIGQLHGRMAKSMLVTE